MEELAGQRCLLPPSTKDVLGGHLHQKVSELLYENFFDDKQTVYDGCLLADKITGILLERPLKEILLILQDEKCLLEKLKLIIMTLHTECPFVPESLPPFSPNSKQKASQEEIGEMLYERISHMEPALASKITGMLLELDDQTLSELINRNDSFLETAVRKAMVVLASDCPPTQKSSSSSLSSLSSKISLTDSNYLSGWKEELVQEDEKKHIGEELYKRILQVHPECASHLTGMILELDLPSLKFLISDGRQLEVAVSRAYTEWIKNS